MACHSSLHLRRFLVMPRLSSFAVSTVNRGQRVRVPNGRAFHWKGARLGGGVLKRSRYKADGPYF